jgi:hypothetical protein
MPNRPRGSLPAARRCRRLAVAAALVLTVAQSACLYGFNAGTGFDVETIAILPFDNQTTRLELTEEIQSQLLRDLPRQLGLILAGDDVADAVVSGTIRDYSLRAPNYRSTGNQGDRPEVLQREVSLVVSVQVLDVERNLILWDDSGIRTQGQYAEGGDEDTGKIQALELLVQRIVDGLQSNW